MDEQQFDTYTEWAESELIWGKGLYNWTRAYSLQEWQRPPLFNDYDELLKVKIPF